MVYIIVFILTVISIFFITLLYNPHIFSALLVKIKRFILVLNLCSVINPSKHLRFNHLSFNKVKLLTLKSSFKSKVFLARYSFMLASGALVIITAGLCLWLLNYSSLDVYRDFQTEQTEFSPQINRLLMGERLSPPPQPPEELFEELDAELASFYAFKSKKEDRGDFSTHSNKFSFPSDNNTLQTGKEVIEFDKNEEFNSSDMLNNHISHGYISIKNADRNWNKMNSKFVQRLLLVYKIMHDQYGYDMVLLEGYRSPQRQARLLAKGKHVTKAGSYRSYHQFGLAADSAFIRNGKIVISERDPWAMQGYKLYGKVAKSVGLVWGGDWRMKDLGHVELRKKGVLGRPEMAKVLTNQ